MLFKKSASTVVKSGRFSDIVRIWVKPWLVAITVAAALPLAPSYAGPNDIEAFISATGTGTVYCSAAYPCEGIADGFAAIGNYGRITCLDGTSNLGERNFSLSSGAANTSNIDVDINCPLGSMQSLVFDAVAVKLRVRHLTFTIGALNSFRFTGAGTVIFEDCTFTGATGPALDIEPNAALNLVIRNSRISDSAAGILLKPNPGGIINATFDHVTITGNTGGGIKIDNSHGPTTLDITDSVIGNNAGNGINAVAPPPFGQVMVSVKNSVFAKNGSAGIQSNGSAGAFLVASTLFDQNAAGAFSVVSSGHISTYGNNQIVGSAGSGFTGSAPLQ